MNIKGIAQIEIGNNCFHKCNLLNKIRKTHGYKQDRMLSGKGILDVIIIYPPFKIVYNAVQDGNTISTIFSYSSKVML